MSDTSLPGNESATRRIVSPGSNALQARGQKRDLPAEQQADEGAAASSQPDHYLEQWPADPKADPDAASALIAEFFQRQNRGKRPDASGHQERFPEHGQALAEMVRSQVLVNSLRGTELGPDSFPRLPEVGDELFGFRLCQSLGNGAFARVFLAEQADLARRPVVLKVSATEGAEPQILARLQHTNIVPIHSVHENESAGLRAVCMPYFGGASLSSVLDRLWLWTRQPMLGEQLVAALESVGCPPPESLNEGLTPGKRGEAPGHASEPPTESRTPVALLRGFSYIKATAWIIAQLADGLHHAHQRGVLHRDIKPSNILLSAEGQPLILDFNVAQQAAFDTAHVILGGTVAYAAPEHLRALLQVTPESIQQVDRRSDLYSLGLVLAEMLAGERLFEQGGSYSALPTQLEVMAVERGKGPPSLRDLRPDIPWGLESIARKCLDPDPERRYQQGDHLADDLRRFLEDRPLNHAPELSRVEQVQKFFRRHPRLTTSGSVTVAAMAVLLAVGGALLSTRGHLAESQNRLGDIRARARMQTHNSGTIRALCLINTTLGRQDHLRQGIAVCEETLALYNLPAGRRLEQHPDWARLTPADRRQLAEDRRELILLLAGARVRLAKGSPRILRGALASLDEAQAIGGLGPSKALWLDRASYSSQLGDLETARRAQDMADTIQVASAREHYLLAVSYARHGGTVGYRKAVAALDQALLLNPRHYWSAIQRGICRLELGELVPAVGDFGVCIGMWPEHSWGYFNRGYVLDRSGMKAEAVNDYTAALDRDPGFLEARVNRGLAHLELKAYKPALADFDKALAIDKGDAVTQAGRGIALEALGNHADADAAFKTAFGQVTDTDPVRSRLLWSYGFAVAARLPSEARDAFDEVLRRDPRQPQALYGRAMLAMNCGQLDTALRFFDRALESDSGFTEARRYRAVVLARRGDWERAGRDINWCLEREPRSAETLYAAACVAARAAKAAPSSLAKDQAFDLLQRALALGSGKKAGEDPDLIALQGDPRFERLIAGAQKPDDLERRTTPTWGTKRP